MIFLSKFPSFFRSTSQLGLPVQRQVFVFSHILSVHSVENSRVTSIKEKTKRQFEEVV